MKPSLLTQPSFSAEPNFDDPITPLKIRPNTLIQFETDGYVILSHPETPQQQGLRVQSDIMLVLWDLVDWKTVGDLLANWPDPVDHPKIVNYIKQFHQLGIILTQPNEALPSQTPLHQAEPAKEQSPQALDELARQQHFNIENHLLMLQDNVRVSAYRRAIERAVTPESVVLDLGCGSGILGFTAHRAGAQHVYGIERRTDILELTQMVAHQNGLERMTFLGGNSHKVPPEAFETLPNVLVAEILGDSVLDEHILEFTLDARDRLLAQGATLIPFKLDLYVFGFHTELTPDRGPAVDELKDLYGVDYSLFGDLLKQKPLTARTSTYNPKIERTLADPVLVKSLNFYELEQAHFEQTFELTAHTEGRFGGYGVYFKAWLDEDTVLTNSPWAPPTHWQHLLYLLNKPKAVQSGDILPFTMTYDGQLKVRLVDENL